MKKGDYIDKLYNEIKDNIELDIDIISIKKLLDAKFELDIYDSIQKWKYILNKYDIKKLSKDMDWHSITIEFPNKIISNLGINKFDDLLKDVNYSKRRFLFNQMFNIFDDNSSVIVILKKYIVNNEKKQEKDFINYIISIQELISKDVFDLTYFLKKVILFHIEYNKINIKYFYELSELPKEPKNKAILKALFVDYI